MCTSLPGNWTARKHNKVINTSNFQTSKGNTACTYAHTTPHLLQHSAQQQRLHKPKAEETQCKHIGVKAVAYDVFICCLQCIHTLHRCEHASIYPCGIIYGGQLGSPHNTIHLVHCFMYFRLLRSPPKILSSMERLMGNHFENLLENLLFQFISTHIIINCWFILITLSYMTIVGRLLDTFHCVLMFSSKIICVLTIYKS